MDCIASLAPTMLTKGGLDVPALPAARDMAALDRAAVEHASDLCISEWSSEDESTSEVSTEDELATPPESPELGLVAGTTMSPPSSPEVPVSAPAIPKRSASLSLSPPQTIVSVTVAGDLSMPRGATAGLGLESRQAKHPRGSRTDDVPRGRRGSTSSESSNEGGDRARAYANGRPRIEIIQVGFEEDADVEDGDARVSDGKLQIPTVQPAKQLNYTGVTAERRAASTRLLSALGKGSPPRQDQQLTKNGPAATASTREGSFIKRASLTARRSLAGSAKACAVPALENLAADLAAARDADAIETPAPSTRSPHPRTPSSGSHSRAASCPEPTLGCQATFGPVHVMVTPPTPRPNGAGGPVYGVVIGSRNTSTQWGRSTSHSRSKSLNDISSTLVPPAFDMAPGRKRMEEERARMAAAQAWQMLRAQQQHQQQQQQHQQQGLMAGGSMPMMPSLCMTSNPWLVQMQLQNQWQLLEAFTNGSSNSHQAQAPAWQPMGSPPRSDSASSSRSTPRDSLENGERKSTVHAEAENSRRWRSNSRRGSEPNCAGASNVSPRAYVPPGRRQADAAPLARTQSAGSKPTRATAASSVAAGAPSKLSAAGRRRFGEAGDVSMASTATVRGEAGRDMLAVLNRLRPARVIA